MCGPMYGISWNLVSWIATDPLPASLKTGAEDWMVGQWFLTSNKVKNWIDEWSGVGDFKKDQIDSWVELIWMHNVKITGDLIKVQQHFLLKDMKQISPTSYVDPTTRSDIPNGAFPLMVNKTHCLDTTYYFTVNAVECASSRSQLWEFDEFGRLSSVYRLKCLDIDLNWSKKNWPFNSKIVGYDCHNGDNQKWTRKKNRFHSKMNDTWILVYKQQPDDIYSNSGFMIEPFDENKEEQKFDF